MITKFALWGIGIAIFAAILVFIVTRENQRIRKQKRNLREMPKLFDLVNEKDNE